MAKFSLKKEIIKDILIIIAGIIIIWLSLWLVFGTQNPFYVVSSESMVPVLQVYDILVVQGNYPLESITLGDIIVFYRPSDFDRVIVHRVVEINGEPYSIRTKGDANPNSIPGVDYPITDREYIGKVVHVIPQAGYLTKILTPPVNYIIIAIIIGVMIFRQYLNKKSKDDDDDDEIKKDEINDNDYSSIDYSNAQNTTTKDGIKDNQDNKNNNHVPKDKQSNDLTANNPNSHDISEKTTNSDNDFISDSRTFENKKRDEEKKYTQSRHEKQNNDNKEEKKSSSTESKDQR